MSRILRHELLAGAAGVLDGRIVHVGTRGEHYVEVWTLDDGGELPRHRYLAVGTGHEFDGEQWEHVGTAVTPSGAFVWHLLRATR